MRTTLALLLLAAPAWASPPVAPPVKQAKKAEPVAAKKAEPPKLERHVEARRADAASSTLSLNTPKKRPHHVTLPDWQP